VDHQKLERPGPGGATENYSSLFASKVRKKQKREIQRLTTAEANYFLWLISSNSRTPNSTVSNRGKAGQCPVSLSLVRLTTFDAQRKTKKQPKGEKRQE
jgi:hypothetical protein